MMGGFYSWDQLDICEPYFDKFYDELGNLSGHHTFKYIDTFFYSMLPRMKIEDKHIVKLLEIKSKVPDTNSMYMNILQDGIELLIRSKTIRELAVAKK